MILYFFACGSSQIARGNVKTVSVRLTDFLLSYWHQFVHRSFFAILSGGWPDMSSAALRPTDESLSNKLYYVCSFQLSFSFLKGERLVTDQRNSATSNGNCDKHLWKLETVE